MAQAESGTSGLDRLAGNVAAVAEDDLAERAFQRWTRWPRTDTNGIVTTDIDPS